MSKPSGTEARDMHAGELECGSMGVSTKAQMTLSNYVVAYLDVLGQSDKLGQLRKLIQLRRQNSLNEQEAGEYDDLVRQTGGTVFDLRDRLCSTLREYWPYTGTTANKIQAAAEHQMTQRAYLVEGPYQLHFFSDSIALTTRYDNENEQPLIRHIYHLLACLSIAMIKYVGERTPLRGAVELGRGFEQAGGAYGPIMLDVYGLERDIAQYPRIVVGQELSNRIGDWTRTSADDPNLDRDERWAIRRCEGMVSADKDGIRILDYLGPTISKDFDLPEVQEAVKSGFSFVSNEYERLQAKQESHLAWKYYLLKEYYSTRLKELWGMS
jgi:hypothetical protein